MRQFRGSALGGVFLALALSCQPPQIFGVELCGNGRDDDENGRSDCSDPACSQDPQCADEPAGVPNWWSQLKKEREKPVTSDCVETLPSSPRPLDSARSCQLFPDDCGFGFRCVALSVQKKFVRSACLRQGCAAPYQPCELAGTHDQCPRNTVCLQAPALCADASCCIPFCSLEAKGSQCSDCRPFQELFDSPIMVPEAEQLGICLDNPG